MGLTRAVTGERAIGPGHATFMSWIKARVASAGVTGSGCCREREREASRSHLVALVMGVGKIFTWPWPLGFVTHSNQKEGSMPLPSDSFPNSSMVSHPPGWGVQLMSLLRYLQNLEYEVILCPTAWCSNSACVKTKRRGTSNNTDLRD